MTEYAITRKVNNKEFYLENMYDDKVIWITDKTQALTFKSKNDLTEMIRNEFPGKDYYPKALTKVGLIYVP
jgi:hypothetical protein